MPSDSRVVYLMRGLPGCGKSHLARRLVGDNGVICETDEYFYTQVGSDPSQYDYKSELLPLARSWNFERFQRAIAKGKSPVIVDRGNGLNTETQEYAVYALQRGYQVELREPDSPWWREIRQLLQGRPATREQLYQWAERLAADSRTTHRVPASTIRDWMDNWRTDVTVELIVRGGRKGMADWGHLLRSFIISCWLAASCLVAIGQAGDQVTFRGGKDGRKVLKATGTITNYTEREIVVQTATGREEEIAIEQLLSVETAKSDELLRAEALFADHRFASATTVFKTAFASERRDWMQRRILAKLAWCESNQRHSGRAAEFALEYLRRDSAAVVVSCLPLAWGSTPTDVSIDEAKRLLEDSRAAAKLVGASWLLSTAERQSALKVLDALASNTDRSPGGRTLSVLADAQRWRTRIATATEAEVANWNGRLKQFPSAFRAGPYYLIGQLNVRLEKWDDAALAFLRVPIEFPDQHEFAGECVLSAARAMERGNKSNEATRLFDELTAKFSDTSAAVSAGKSKSLTTGGTR